MAGHGTIVRSRFGTITPKDFQPKVLGAELLVPTGVINYERVELRAIIPELGDINLANYYLLRIACCAYIGRDHQGNLQSCGRCGNRGYVCPACLGARMVRDRGKGMPCSKCMLPYTDERGKLRHLYDEQSELTAVRGWVARRFPYGIPAQLSEAERVIADGY